MPQRYRLHLSDGTVLLVDHDSLNTWLVDRKATVQLEGSSLWLPLREFLAAERAAAFRATPRKTAKTREELPLIPPPPRKSDKGPTPAEPTEPKASVFEPPAPQTPTPPPPLTPPPQPLRPPSPLTPPPALTPPTPPLEPWRRPPLTPPPEREPERIVRPAEPLGRPPERFEPAPFPPAREAQIGAPPGVEPVAAAPVAPPRKPLPRPITGPDQSMPPIPLVPLDEAPVTPAIPLAEERGARARPSASPRFDDAFGAEDRGRAAPDSYGQDLPVIPLKPIPEQDQSYVPPWSRREAGASPDEAFEDSFDDELPADQGLRHADVVFLRMMATLGGFLSRALAAAARFERRQRARRTSARSAPAAPRPADPAQAADEPRTLGELLASAIPRPVRKPKPEPEPRSPAAQPTDEPRSLGELIASAIPRPARKPEPEAFEEDWPAISEPPPPPVASAGPSVPASRPPSALKPPPLLSEIPVLRLAEIREAEVTGDLYDGESPDAAGPGLLHGLWLWTKRLVVLGVLLGGGAWAAFTWKSWFPRAGEVGERALTTIDEQVRSKEIEAQRAQASREGAEQLPQLAPETIRLILSKSAGGRLGVPELFQAASDAADRGGASLTSEEAGELTALRGEQLAGLHPSERERVRDYERSRAIGAAFPAEERAAIELVAQGTRLLPAQRLARLQALLGKAIAAGLTAPSPPSP